MQFPSARPAAARVAVTPAVAQHATISDQAHALIVGGPAAWWPLLGSVAHVVINLAIGVGMLLVTLWVAKWASELAKNGMARLHGRAGAAPDSILLGFVGSLVRYAVIVVGLIAVLGQVGVQTTSVLAVLGAASLAIGLALQGGLSNVAAGVMLLFLRPYRVGDRVKIAGIEGKVKGLDLFITRINDFDNSAVFIPNSKALGDVIINYTMTENRRIVMDFGIDYDDDVDLALQLLIATAKADKRIVAKPEPWAKVTVLGDSTVTVTLRAWTSPDGYIDTRFDLIKDVKAAFEKAGLSFPYPHQVSVSDRRFTAPNRERQQEAREVLGLKAEPPPVHPEVLEALDGSPGGSSGSTSEAD